MRAPESIAQKGRRVEGDSRRECSRAMGGAMIRRTILAGGGHAHLAVLADWARVPAEGAERVLVTSARTTAYSGMLPGWMAGIYRADQLQIDLAPLARRAGARLIIDPVAELDADCRTITLASGARLEFDLLSLATGGAADLSALAALGDRVLPAKPIERFMPRWAALLAQAQSGAAIRLAVVGGGAGGVELALAAQAALRAHGGAITLVAAPPQLLPGHAPAVRARVLAELARRGIALRTGRATATAEGLLLDDGSALPVSHVIAATGSRAPGWLAGSGLALTAQGFIEVGADLRSTSHPCIFAAGDVIERTDRALPRSGVHAVKAGPVLAANLHAAATGGPLSHYQPGRRTLYLLATGERRAIASWGALAFGGRLAWWLKDRIDRRFVARYRQAGPSVEQEDKEP